MDIGMNHEERKKIADGVSSVLADTYTLYLKTQNFHWNVTGPRFHQLHGMFEEHYKEMAEAVDEIAERVRALGHRAPGTFKEFNELKSIPEHPRDFKPDTMIEQLVEDHEAVARKAKEVIMIADEFGDDASADLLTSRIQNHQKTAWMLRSFLQ